MRKLISCEINTDSARVELRYIDGTLWNCAQIMTYVFVRFYDVRYIDFV